MTIMNTTMITKEFHLLPLELFLDLTYPDKAPGWINSVYFPRTAVRVTGNSCVSYIRDFQKKDSDKGITVISSKVWKEIEPTGYGIYFYEDTSVLSFDLENGNYQITATLKNPSDKSYFCHIRANQIVKEEAVKVSVDDSKVVSFYVPVYTRHLELAFLFGNLAELDTTPIEGCVFLSSITIEKMEKKAPGKKPTIFLASDSTVQSYESIYYPQTGWGQMLYHFFTAQNQITESPCNSCSYPQAKIYETEYVIIENRSIGGRSSKSFIEEGKLDAIIHDLRPGDFLFAQWGHNDATAVRPNRYVSADDFQTFLLPYYQACQMTGAQLVLITPVARRNCDENGTFQISFPAYREQMINFAAKYQIPLLDLGKYSTEFLQTMTPEESKSVFLWLSPGQYPDGAYPDGLSDNTHLQRYGATVFADIVALLIQKEEQSSKLNQLKVYVHPIDPLLIEKPAPFQGFPAPRDSTMVTGFAVQEITKEQDRGNFLLHFDDVADAVAYHIYRKKKTDLTYQIIKTISDEEKKSSTTLPFSEEGGASYQYYVAAVFKNGTEGRASRIIEIDFS